MDWNSILKINNWQDIMNKFVEDISLKDIINSQYQPIYKVILQWSYHLKVLCIIIKKYYLLELNRF